jgi:uncharacterized membrane protein
MSSTNSPGRVAGFWYLLLIVIGPLPLIIAAHDRLFRFGIVSNLVCAVILILLTLAFYRLFKGVKEQALAAVTAVSAT